MIVLAFLILIFVPAVAFGAYSATNYRHVYAKQYVGDINFGGKQKDELRQVITQRSEEFAGKDINLHFKDDKGEKDFSIKPAEIGLHYDVDATVEDVWRTGRSINTWQAFWQQLHSLFVPVYHEAKYTYSQDLLNAKLDGIAKEVDAAEKDFYISYEGGKFKLAGDRVPGKRIDQEEITARITYLVTRITNGQIDFSTKEYKPQVSEAKAKDRLADANKIVQGGDLVVAYDTQQFKLDPDTIGGMIKSKTNGDDLELYFNDERLGAFIDTIAAAVNVQPANAKLTVSNGKATVFQQSQEGRTVDKDKTGDVIKTALLSRITDDASAATKQVAVVVEKKKPDVTENDINNLGIVELVGTAYTNFKGSPANRIHNIQTGAAALNGVLLSSDETFSTLARLGEISDKSGYLPELVIKENQTVPEFGGGLCQVSSTLFRAALNAGMRIVERQNHKYRVSYYEPPVGMDATIYDPAPDFKFKNNYASHILIQSKVEGTKITFDLYGTKDSRKVEIGDSQVYDIVDPGPRINVETDTLPAGEEKQIEKAHQGASAKFHYKVARDGQTLQETDFVSKYVPWPEKWLVGKAAAPAATPAPSAPPAQ